MADVKWTMRGLHYDNCNCAYGCPCQFNALPTHGHCEFFGVMAIHEGSYGDIRLGGLKAAMMARWPGPIHLGHGQRAIIVDERGTPEQRRALLRIFSGEDTEPGKNIWNIFKLMSDTTEDPVYATIDFVMDKDARTAKAVIKGVADSRVEPILNPVTGDQHQVRIQQGPGAFEYDVAEVARGWTRTFGPIALDLADSHAHMHDMHFNQNGLIRAT
jgi:hypothetical protein